MTLFSLSLSCSGNYSSGNSANSTPTNLEIPPANQPLSPPPESCPVSSGNFTGTWSNNALNISDLTAVSSSGNLITLFKSPCGDIPVAGATIQSDGSFSFTRSNVTVQGVITSSMATGTISYSTTCLTPQSWSASRIANDSRALVSFNKISPVNSGPRLLTTSTPGFTDAATNGFGLFTTNSQVSITASGGTAVFWGPAGCSGQTCTFTVNPGYTTYQVNIQ